MNKPLVADRKGHPKDVKLSDALEEDKPRSKAQKGLISKKATLVTAGISDGELQKIVGETMQPSSEQLEKINKFTRRPVTAEEVVAFTTLSCNDIPDRDDDQFTTECVKDFASLEQPFSPVGKSFMLDHNYSTGNAVGRIFGVDTAKVGGDTFLTNEVYLPNTEQFQPLIEKIDFGISWAVSVGVVLGKSQCSLSFCDAGFSSWGYWCRNGHDKGLYYTEDAEEDNWGYPEPCDPKTSGAEKCLQLFKEPRDFYELSQVFLGAQYYAALEDKSPEFAVAVKSAGTNKFVGASADEAEKLPLRHEPKKVSEARKSFTVSESEDGSLNWTDENSLVWTYDPEDPDAEVLCLGKAKATKSEEDEDDGSTERGSGSDEQLDPEDSGVGGSEDDAEGSSDDQSEAGGSSELGSEGSQASVGAEGSENDDKEKALSKADVLKAAKAAELDDKLVKAVEDGEGNGLAPLLLALTAENKDLSKRAVLGDAYLKELRSEAIDWYVKSHATGDNQAVKTETFERMLDRFGDDVDLYHSVIEENQALAQEKFPKKVRRSSFPNDPHEVKELDEPTFEQENDERVKRIHG